MDILTPPALCGRTEKGMKKYIAILLSAAMTASLLPRAAVFASDADELIANGGFESYDSKTEFPKGWSSDGENLLLAGDFEIGSAALTSVGKSPTGNDIRWASPSTGTNDVTIVSAKSDEEAEHGKYYARMRFKANNWGGIGYTNLSGTNYLLDVIYGGSYIFRADYRVSKQEAFPDSQMAFYYLVTTSANEVKDVTKFEPRVTDTKKPSTAWQTAELPFKFMEKPTASGYTYYDLPHVQRMQLRYNTKANASESNTADMFVDNMSLEKLGRTSNEKAYSGSRSLKYVGYDDNSSEDWKSDALNLSDGGEYIFTYYSLGSGADAYIEAANGEKISFTEENSENDGDWVKTTAKFTANGEVKVCLTGGNNTVYFDDVSIKEVLKPASVKIEAENSLTYVKKDSALKLTAAVYDKKGGLMAGENVSYSIKESDIDAQISEDGVLSVGAEAVLGSYVTVVAEAVSDTSLKDEIRLLICGEESMPVTVVISGDKKLPTLTAGEYTKKNYTATVYDQYGDEVSEGVNIVWAASEDGTTAENVVISENGEVSVLEDAKAGKLVIFATAEKDGIVAVSESFELVITQSVEGIRFEVGGVSVEEGGERTVKVIFIPENAENKNFTVTSSDESIFEAVRTIDGVSVTSVSKGDAVITATSTDGGFTAELIATTAENAAEGIDTEFEKGGAGWNVNKFNIIPNGDFEKNAEWSPVGANPRADSGYVKKEEAPEQVFEGESSGYVKYGSAKMNNRWAGFRNQTVQKVVPASLYHLSMAVNIPSIEAEQFAALSFRIDDENGVILEKEASDVLKVKTATNGWEVKETEYRIPQNGTKLHVISARTNGDAGFAAYFDNLVFETVAGVVENEAYEGTGSMRIGAYDGIHGMEYQTASSDAIEIEASSVYNVAAMVKSLDVTAKAGIGIEYLDSDKKVIKSANTDSASFGDWSEVSIALTAPENARYLRVLLISDGVGVNCFDSVSVVKEAAYPDSVDIKGAGVIAIPAKGEKVRSYEALVLDRFGEPMKDKTALLELVSAPSGVSIDANSLKISKSAKAGDIVLRARYDDFTKKITVKLINVTSFEIEGVPDSVERGVNNKSYDISVVMGIDSKKTELENSEVEYSIVDSDEEIYVEGSQLIVKSTAKLGEFKVKAVYKEDNDVVAEKSVTVKKRASSGTGGGGGGGGGGGTGGGVAYIENTPKAPSEVEEPTGTVKMNNPATITDVGENHWAYQAINTFAKSGIVSGRGGSRFEPEGIITRSEFLKILVSVFGLETSYEIVNFTDTVETAWYYQYVSTAVANKIAFGYPDGSFGINTPVTREEMAVFIERAMAVNNTKLKEAENVAAFPDQDMISPFASDAVLKMKGAGIISGDENGMFNPKNNATRAEAVWMLYKIYTMR